MRIYEVDDRALVVKLKALIDHPSTNPNMRATAQQRYDAIMASQGHVTTNTEWNPTMVAVSPSGYEQKLSSENWDRQFINRDGCRCTFASVVSGLRRFAPDEIIFSNIDMPVNKLNANRVVARHTPEITLRWATGTANPEGILDTLRQLTSRPWSSKGSGRIIVISYAG